MLRAGSTMIIFKVFAIAALFCAVKAVKSGRKSGDQRNTIRKSPVIFTVTGNLLDPIAVPVHETPKETPLSLESQPSPSLPKQHAPSDIDHSPSDHSLGSSEQTGKGPLSTSPPRAVASQASWTSIASTDPKAMPIASDTPKGKSHRQENRKAVEKARSKAKSGAARSQPSVTFSHSGEDSRERFRKEYLNNGVWNFLIKDLPPDAVRKARAEEPGFAYIQQILRKMAAAEEPLNAHERRFLWLTFGSTSYVHEEIEKITREFERYASKTLDLLDDLSTGRAWRGIPRSHYKHHFPRERSKTGWSGMVQKGRLLEGKGDESARAWIHRAKQFSHQVPSLIRRGNKDFVRLENFREPIDPKRQSELNVAHQGELEKLEEDIHHLGLLAEDTRNKSAARPKDKKNLALNALLEKKLGDMRLALSDSLRDNYA